VLRMPLKHFILLLGLILLSWGQAVQIGFLNDDIQIIGIAVPGSLAEVFAPAVSGNVWGVYWRPLLKILHNFQLFAVGHSAMLFHATGLLLFTLACCAAYFLVLGLTNQKRTAFIAAAMFTIMPSRELAVLWISDQSELLVFIFMVLMLLNIKRYIEAGSKTGLYISGIAFLFALLSKELAFGAILLPWAGFFFAGDKKIKRSRVIRSLLLFSAVFGMYFIYRMTVIGSNPFQSDHVADITLAGVIKNFLLYIPSVFVNPDMMEYLYVQGTGSVLTAVLLIVPAVIFTYALFKKRASLSQNKKLIILGLFWFVLLLLPVLPVYMRWYAFSASAGLFLITALLLQIIFNGMPDKQIKIISAVVLLLISMYNFTVTSNWVEAGKMMERIGDNIRENREYLEGKKVVLWSVPDKYNRVPVMKLGQKEIFEFYSKSEGFSIHSPLRSELVGTSPEVVVESADSSGFVLNIYGGRFLPEGGRSRAVIIDEVLNSPFDGGAIQIVNQMEAGYPAGRVVVSNLAAETNTLHLYFNGKDFERIKKRQE